MSIVIRDLTPDFLAFAADAAMASDAERERLWRQRYVDRHPDVFDRYFRRHPPVSEQLSGLLAELCHRTDQLRIRAQAVYQQAGDALATAATVLGTEPAGIDGQAIVMVGLYGANGWVDELVGRPELFVAVEQVPDDERYRRALLTHEAAHVVHLRRRAGSAWPHDGIAAGDWAAFFLVEMGVRERWCGVGVADRVVIVSSLPDLAGSAGSGSGAGNGRQWRRTGVNVPQWTSR